MNSAGEMAETVAQVDEGVSWMRSREVVIPHGRSQKRPDLRETSPETSLKNSAPTSGRNAATCRTCALRDGWFRTGDLIERTAHGDIRLIGRKKDVIITRGGKTINPQPIETRLKGSVPINEAIVIGDGHRYLTVLIELSTATGAHSAAKLTERLQAEIDRPTQTSREWSS